MTDMAKETLHIMIVDDEVGMRLAVERALRNFVCRVEEVDSDVGFQISMADSGEEALALIAKAKPDVLLLDYKLGGISGIDVLMRLIEHKLDIMVVMITAYASLETAVQATKLGAFDFLAKPFTPEELKGVVRKVVHHFMLQRQARNLSEERKKIRFQFLSVLAHELKAPLAAVEGYLRILDDEKVSGDAATLKRTVSRSLVRIEGMTKLIADLLDLTRIESGQRKRNIAEIDVAEIARTAVETALPMANEKDVSVFLRAQSPVVMAADAGEIEIILNNLISNAVKYNREGGKVDVVCERLEDKVLIGVSDTGIGMTGEESKRIFDEFSRIKNEKTRSILGSGLGLSIVKRLANLYGGSVDVESQPDVGSTFIVTLGRLSPETVAASQKSLSQLVD
jgi:signal transduction histidine kinase